MHRLIFILWLLSSCSIVDGYNRREFLYHGRKDHQKIILHIPKGYAEEKILLDTTGGKEQYYYYSGGALVYFTNNVSWPTENDSLIRRMNGVRASGNAFVFKGVDKDGLYWKEIRHERFRFGYSYVPKEYLDRFESTINSIRLK